MTESKWFRGFDWFYRLVIINLLTIVVIVVIAIGPLLIWYYNENLYIFLIFGMVLGAVALIPCTITSFFIIKYYKEEKSANIIGLYFKTLILVIKNVYLYELIMICAGFIFSLGLSYYWKVLGPDNFSGFDFWGIVAILGFVVCFFCLVGLIFALINVPMIISYFNMKTKDLLKFSFYISFRYFFRTFLYFLIITTPVILMILYPSLFVPLYTLLGISFPLFLIFRLSQEFYHYLSRNINDIKDSDNYDLQGDEDEIRN